jgi:hypothetical protein
MTKSTDKRKRKRSKYADALKEKPKITICEHIHRVGDERQVRLIVDPKEMDHDLAKLFNFTLHDADDDTYWWVPGMPPQKRKTFFSKMSRYVVIDFISLCLGENDARRPTSLDICAAIKYIKNTLKKFDKLHDGFLKEQMRRLFAHKVVNSEDGKRPDNFRINGNYCESWYMWKRKAGDARTIDDNELRKMLVGFGVKCKADHIKGNKSATVLNSNIQMDQTPQMLKDLKKALAPFEKKYKKQLDGRPLLVQTMDGGTLKQWQMSASAIDEFCQFVHDSGITDPAEIEHMIREVGVLAKEPEGIQNWATAIKILEEAEIEIDDRRPNVDDEENAA